ncbi:DUF202 domain-containing protein [Cesiribacter andamanensis]|uniref:Putative membrane protein n=1 Tax=Cesiribacter andamanensis AMV16 TaxID=1279009 RepID=M7NJP1_9BACT|nr:DUF202 domain-containing protein [Cesiribacter andamanensis]EMR02015.1 putative membrane protein [Cesiribacter andamanensis AMV16]
MQKRFLKHIRFGYHFENTEEIILRDFLAMERTRLANERTFLSYIRTALFFLTGGLTLLQLRDYTDIRWIGYVAVSVSVVMIVIGTIRYYRLMKRLLAYYRQLSLDKAASKPMDQ